MMGWMMLIVVIAEIPEDVWNHQALIYFVSAPDPLCDI